MPRSTIHILWGLTYAFVMGYLFVDAAVYPWGTMIMLVFVFVWGYIGLCISPPS